MKWIPWAKYALIGSCLFISCENRSHKVASRSDTEIIQPEDKAIILAKEYLDDKILGTKGGSANWVLKPIRYENSWLIIIPNDVIKSMPGGFPDKLIINLENNTVSTKEKE